MRDHIHRSFRVIAVLALSVGLTSCRAEEPTLGSMTAGETPTFSADGAALAPVETEMAPPSAQLPPTSGAEPTPGFDLGAVQLLEECTESPYDGTPPPGWFEPCSDFAFSPDGRYLGFFFGPEICGRGIYILDTQTGQPVYRGPHPGGGHGFELLANGNILLITGHCEGGGINLLEPDTGEIRFLGAEGRATWNASRTALAVAPLRYVMLESTVWGYNDVEDSVFLPQPEESEWQRDDHPVWTPDGTHLIFQHRLISYDRDTDVYSFPAARQIIRVDATTGERRVLLDDPRYDFHFCAPPLPDNGCDPWHGDWIQVRRFPFKPQDISYGNDFYFDPVASCLLYGLDCPEPPTLFALNWRTGELIPWDEAALPTPVPAPTPTRLAPFG